MASFGPKKERRVLIHYQLDGAVCQQPVIHEATQLTVVAEDVTCERCLILVGAQMIDTLSQVMRALGKLAVTR